MTGNGRDLVLVSGYYGFGNLGDEAILEELTNELKQLTGAERIHILSNCPEHTERVFGVRSINRWKFLQYVPLLRRTTLFISGGGGLFQDTQSIKSSVYYGAQIFLAKLFGAQVMIYAQGIGPLRTTPARAIARRALSMADAVSVRDEQSFDLLKEWNIEAQLTADPVWALTTAHAPQQVQNEIERIGKERKGMLVGLSLRESYNFGEREAGALSRALLASLPENTRLVLLPLQTEQDLKLLQTVRDGWLERGREALLLNTDVLVRPAEWMSVLRSFDLVIGMRLHALILSLRAGVPVVGLAYDPKVTHVMEQFEQPILNLPKELSSEELFQQWLTTIEDALPSLEASAQRAAKHAEAAKKLACQNFQLLAKILGMQSDPQSS